MSRMGFSIFTDGYNATDVVAPKSNYPTKEEFIEEAKVECEGYDWEEKVTVENVKEGYCRFFPNPPEYFGDVGGCYMFCKQGKGAFPVWYIDIR